jgi:putative transposase
MLYKNKYRVESARLKNWDYSSNGCYYVTICTHDRIHYFGTIQNSKMTMSDIGAIAAQYWREIPNHFPIVRLDEWIIMPNHVHGIIAINNNDINTQQTNKKFSKSRFQNQGKGTISAIVGSYKSICTKTINKSQNKIQFAWQPRFYDHIIRDEMALNRIRTYILNNPTNWNSDDFYGK